MSILLIVAIVLLVIGIVLLFRGDTQWGAILSIIGLLIVVVLVATGERLGID